ncbi:hypothetical protein F4861DRAFT_549784, partial [Xylaria intraflava]
LFTTSLTSPPFFPPSSLLLFSLSSLGRSCCPVFGGLGFSWTSCDDSATCTAPGGPLARPPCRPRWLRTSRLALAGDALWFGGGIRLLLLGIASVAAVSSSAAAAAVVVVASYVLVLLGPLCTDSASLARRRIPRGIGCRCLHRRPHHRSSSPLHWCRKGSSFRCFCCRPRCRWLGLAGIRGILPDGLGWRSGRPSRAAGFLLVSSAGGLGRLFFLGSLGGRGGLLGLKT